MVFLFILSRMREGMERMQKGRYQLQESWKGDVKIIWDLKDNTIGYLFFCFFNRTDMSPRIKKVIFQSYFLMYLSIREWNTTVVGTYVPKGTMDGKDDTGDVLEKIIRERIHDDDWILSYQPVFQKKDKYFPQKLISVCC
jgi:hypothetical protein